MSLTSTPTNKERVMRAYVGTYYSGKDAHTLIVEKVLGKKLPAGAEVHHVDSDGRNNKNTNLVVCPTKSYHKLLHRRTEALEASGNPNFRKCYYCKHWDAEENLYIYEKGTRYQVHH